MRKAEATVGSVVFFAFNPAMMGGLVPLLLTGWHSAHPPRALEVAGTALIVLGAGVLLDTIARFVFEGGGTPAPAAPTQELVIGGPYRHVRNPMYLAVLAAILGQALLLGRIVLLIYAGVFWLIVASFARFYEEPILSDSYGEQYAAYHRAVPGWLPRLRQWSPEP
ncbi:MAG: isoprenylcysteine carboxyl methyltransferase [Pseudonocardiales bacterium]|nr:MAG: isoprenylcysteine carboxyl methyltransferase [Pseudonocardiales bacterium]